MQDFLTDMAFATLIGLLKRTVNRDSAAKSKWKNAMLKLFFLIRDNYADEIETFEKTAKA